MIGGIGMEVNNAIRLIEDFGITLKGAAKERYYTVDDVLNMSLHELMTKVQKRVIWKELNWKQVYEDNVNLDAKILYYARMIRDKYKVRPNIKRVVDIERARELCAEYISVTNKLEKACLVGIETGDIAIIQQTIDELSVMSLKDTGLKANLVLLRTIRKEETDDACLLQDFPNHIVGKLKNAFLSLHKKQEFNAQGVAEEKDCYIISKRTVRGGVSNVVSTMFSSKNDAYTYSLTNLVGKKYERGSIDMNRLVYLMRPELKSIERVGPDIRHNVNCLDLDMLNEFNIAGGEFGVWHSQKDRQAVLNYTYDAFSDLAYILGIPHEGISLEYKGKKLSISYGARGAGMQEKAKYLKDSNNNEIIHIQKLKGAGWVSRAYGSALDNYMGAEFINGDKEPLSWYATVNRGLNHGNTALLAAYGEFKNELVATGYLSSLRKLSPKLQKKVFELCFECYVEDKLEQKGLRNDYLVSYTKPQQNMNSYFWSIYPQGASRERICRKIDNLLNVALEELRKGHIAVNEDADNELTNLNEAYEANGVKYKKINDSVANEAYNNTFDFKSYIENIVSTEDLEDITDDEAKSSSLSLISRLNKMGNVDDSYTITKEQKEQVYKNLLKKGAALAGIKIALADTRSFLNYYNSPYFITKYNRTLVLNIHENIDVKIESLIAGLVEFIMSDMDTVDDVTGITIKNATTYYLCKLSGVDVADKYCKSDLMTNIVKDSVVTGKLLDEVNNITSLLLTASAKVPDKVAV